MLIREGNLLCIIGICRVSRKTLIDLTALCVCVLPSRETDFGLERQNAERDRFLFSFLQALLAALDPLFKCILYIRVFLISPRSLSRESVTRNRLVCMHNARISNYASFLVTFILLPSSPARSYTSHREDKPALHTGLSLNAFSPNGSPIVCTKNLGLYRIHLHSRARHVPGRQ